MPRNSPLDENEKGQISANKLEGKFISFIAWKNENEKKFNLNGLDCPLCYWQDFSKEKQLFSKRPFK